MKDMAWLIFRKLDGHDSMTGRTQAMSDSIAAWIRQWPNALDGRGVYIPLSTDRSIDERRIEPKIMCLQRPHSNEKAHLVSILTVRIRRCIGAESIAEAFGVAYRADVGLCVFDVGEAGWVGAD